MPLPRVLAVDCGAGHVACGLFGSDKSGRLQLEKLSYNAFNPDASLESDWQSMIGQSLGEAVRRDRLSGDASIGLPGHHILGKPIKIPQVEESKRFKIVQFEAQQNLPYGLDEIVWDYQVVSEQGLDLELMLAAAKKEIVDGVCSSLSDAGLSVASVIPSSIAVARCFRYNYPEVTGSVLLVDIGARSMNFIFLDADRFFVRTVNWAGNSITQGISEELKHDFAHCENVKVQVLNDESDLPPTSSARTAVHNAVNSFLGKLHLEITRSIVNYRRQSSAEQPTTLYVTGGGSVLAELPAKLGEKLKLPVERLDPLRNVTASAPGAADLAPVLAGLVGLAVPAERGRKVINLLPTALAERHAFKRRQPLLIAAAALVALAVVPPLVQSMRAVGAAKSQLAHLDQAIRPLESVQGSIRKNLELVESVKKEVLAVQSLAESKNNWINFLTDLQDRLVKIEDVWLESLQVSRDGGNGAPAPARAATGGLFGAAPTPPRGVASEDTEPAKPVLRLQLSGRLLDRKNPVQKVSADSYERVKSLLASFAGSEFISTVERESFDPATPGILRFNFVLVLDPARPL